MKKRPDSEAIKEALKYSNKRDWRFASLATYKMACRNTYLWDKCTAHMKRPARFVGPTKGKFRYRDSDFELSAIKFDQLNKWKVQERQYYEACRRRHGIDSDFWKRITSHMKAPINPYRDLYYAYACEFESRTAYVGISGMPEGERWERHLDPKAKRISAVLKHIIAHPDDKYEFHVVERQIDKRQVEKKEGYWQQKYAAEGWKPLHSGRPGSLGALPTITREMCEESATECMTLSEFALRFRHRYNISKKRGWFDEITSHMPRDLEQKTREANLKTIASRPVSDETRRRQSEAKLGRPLSPEHVQAIRESHTPEVDALGQKKRLATIAQRSDAYSWIVRGWKLSEAEALYLGLDGAGQYEITAEQKKVVRNYRYKNKVSIDPADPVVNQEP